MWNKRVMSSVDNDPDDSSWEVRAFEDDMTAGNLSGCTWPPRSYTCAFCRRDFRSAQALGGHMNVHRRERANQLQQQTNPSSPPPLPVPIKSSSAVVVPNDLCCIIYAIPNDPNTTKTEPEEVDLVLRLGQRQPPPP